MKSATRVMISTMGAFLGLMGAEHGIGEILQGNAAPAGLFIESWPGSKFFEVLSGEPALTVIPNMLVTGILATLVSLAYAAWAVWFVERRHGGLVLMLLCIPMLLFGGGLFPPVIGLIIGAAATRINAPLNWWQKRLPEGARRALGAIWPWALGLCLLSWLAMFPGVTILSYYFGIENEMVILTIMTSMFGFLFLSAITGFARDAKPSRRYL